MAWRDVLATELRWGKNAGVQPTNLTLHSRRPTPPLLQDIKCVPKGNQAVAIQRMIQDILKGYEPLDAYQDGHGEDSFEDSALPCEEVRLRDCWDHCDVIGSLRCHTRGTAPKCGLSTRRVAVQSYQTRTAMGRTRSRTLPCRARRCVYAIIRMTVDRRTT